MSAGTLANWRAAKPRKGPRFLRVGSSVRYRWGDVVEWEGRQVSK